VRTHAEAVRNGFEVFLLFVNAVLGAPPPCLVDEGAVGGIHEADDAVVNANGHFRLQVCEFVFAGKFFDLRGGVGRFSARDESGAGRGWVGDEDPDEIVLLFATVAAGVDAIDFEILIGGERRDQLTLAVVHVELPSVISALEIFSVKFSAVKGHAAMGTGIAQGEGLSETVAADNQRDLEEGRFVELVAVNPIGR